ESYRCQAKTNTYISKEMDGVNDKVNLNAEISVDEAIGTLVAYSFINVAYTENGEKYTLHRLVQTFTRYWLRDYRRTADLWATNSLWVLVNEFPKMAQNPRARLEHHRFLQRYLHGLCFYRLCL